MTASSSSHQRTSGTNTSTVNPPIRRVPIPDSTIRGRPPRCPERSAGRRPVPSMAGPRPRRRDLRRLPPRVPAQTVAHRHAARRDPSRLRSTAGRLGARRPTGRTEEGSTRLGPRAPRPRPLTPGDCPAPGMGPQHSAPVRERHTLAGNPPREPASAQQAGPLQAPPGAAIRRRMHQCHSTARRTHCRQRPRHLPDGPCPHRHPPQDSGRCATAAAVGAASDRLAHPAPHGPDRGRPGRPEGGPGPAPNWTRRPDMSATSARYLPTASAPHSPPGSTQSTPASYPASQASYSTCFGTSMP